MNRRNCSIDMFRYICAVLVVAIHTAPLTEINDIAGFVLNQVIVRIAVPFFFVTSGYFYYIRMKNNNEIFMSYIGKIIKPYLLWSCIYYSIDYMLWGYTNLKEFLWDSILNFFIYGSHYHFWFYPVLCIAITVTTIFYKFKSKKLLFVLSSLLYIMGCLGTSYKRIGEQILILNVIYNSNTFILFRRVFCMGIPFFVMGVIIAEIKNKLKNKKMFVGRIVLSTIMIYIMEITIIIFVKCGTDFVITFSLYPLMMLLVTYLLEHPMYEYVEISKKMHMVANITYYAHPMMILIIDICCEKMFKIPYVLAPTLKFILVIAMTFILGMLQYIYKEYDVKKKCL